MTGNIYSLLNKDAAMGSQCRSLHGSTLPPVYTWQQDLNLHCTQQAYAVLTAVQQLNEIAWPWMARADHSHVAYL